LEECKKKELSQKEKSEGGIFCCFAESDSIKGCDYVNKRAYMKILKGKNNISDNIGYNLIDIKLSYKFIYLTIK
jgi:hypothetical protein